MKKMFSLLLCAILISGLAACGSQKETTPAPTEPAPQTSAAPTERPTESTAESTAVPTAPEEPTQVPTEPPVTKPEPTTEEPAETTAAAVEPAAAEDVFLAMGKNLAKVLQAVDSPKAAPVQLSFTASGEAKVLLQYAKDSDNFSFPLEVSGHAEGILDSEKGIHLNAEYSENLSNLLLAMMGQEAETTTEKLELYRDVESGRSYQKKESEDQWYYDSFEMSDEPAEPDMTGFTPENLFQTYTFWEENDFYVFEGPLNLRALQGVAGNEEAPEIISGLSLDDLTVNLKLLIDQEMRLSSLTLEAEEISFEMTGEMMDGFSAKLEVLKVEGGILYENVAYVLPEEVKENAVQTSGDNPDEGKNPWSDNVFITDNDILADNEFFCLKAVRVEDDWFGVKVAYLFENKSDKNLTMEFRAISVNGYVCDLVVYESFKPKESREFEKTIDEDHLLQIGVDSIDEIMIQVEVNDNDSYKTLSSETYVYYPTGLTASQIVYPERKTGEKDFAVIDTDEYRLYFVGTEYDSFLGFVLVTYIENNSNQDLVFVFDNITINGTAFSAYWRPKMISGCRGYDKQYFSIQSINVNQVETLSATLKIKDNNDYQAEPVQTVEFSFEP